MLSLCRCSTDSQSFAGLRTPLPPPPLSLLTFLFVLSTPVPVDIECGELLLKRLNSNMSPALYLSWEIIFPPSWKIDSHIRVTLFIISRPLSVSQDYYRIGLFLLSLFSNGLWQWHMGGFQCGSYFCTDSSP